MLHDAPLGVPRATVPRLRWTVFALLPTHLWTFLAAALLVLAQALPASAALDRWLPYPRGVGGPWGGSVRRLVASDPLGLVLWAATGGGIFRSDDGGDSWQPRSAGLECLDVTDLAVSVGEPARLIAATGACGVYLTEDAGLTWQRVPSDLLRAGGRPQSAFWRVAVDPTDPGRLFAATAVDAGHLLEFAPGPGAGNPLSAPWFDYGEYPVERFVVAADGALFFGTRGGRLYVLDASVGVPVPIWEHPERAAAVDLVLPGGDGSTVVVAHGGGGLWVGSRGGSAWDSLSHPAPDDTWVERHLGHFPPSDENPFPHVESLAAHPLDRERLTYFTEGQPPRLYRLDLGAHQPAAVVPLPEEGLGVTALLSGAAEEWLGEASAGVYRDRGNGYAHASRGLAAYVAVDFAFGADGSLAVAGGGGSSFGSGGLQLWQPAGAWARVATGLPPGNTGLVRYRGAELWAAVQGLGLFRSRDGGAAWEGRNGSLGVTVTRSFSGLVFAADRLDVAVAAMAAGVYVTADGGEQWVQVPAIPLDTGWRVAGDSLAPGHFYAAGSQGFAGRIFRTADRGATWSERAAFPDKQLNALEAVPGGEGHLLAGTADAGGLESRDGGGTWANLGEIGSGLPQTGNVALLAASPGDGALLACLVNGVPYLARTGERHWEPVTAGFALPGERLPGIQRLGFDPSGTRLVAATAGQGLWYVDMIEDVWPPAVTALPPGGVYRELPQVELRADEWATIFYTTDGSAPNQDSASGPSPRLVTLPPAGGEVRFFAVDEAGNAGAAGRAAYRTDAIAPVVVAAPSGGTYAEPVEVELIADEEARICFTADGSAPHPGSPVYQGPLLLGATTTLRFFAVDEAGNVGAAGTETYLFPTAAGGGGGGGGCFVSSLGW